MKKMKRALYVATVVKTHIMEFHIPYLKMLKEMGFETAVAARNDYENPEDCVIPYCDHYYDIHFERSPFSFANIKAYKELKKIIDEGHYDIVHCHTPVAAILTRIAARKARKNGSKVFYTAHGFHFYTGAPIQNWLLYYPAEWLCSWWTDVLITINKEDHKRASERFHAKKTVYIPGVGVDMEKFKPRENGREKIRKELGLKDSDIMLLSVGELNENKNHEAVIRALAKLPDFALGFASSFETNSATNDSFAGSDSSYGSDGYDSVAEFIAASNLVYVIVGRGELNEHLHSVAQELGVKLILTGYRNDVADFYDAADVYMLPSLREGLNVSLMEAMASSLAVTCSKIRGDVDLIDNEYCLFDPTDVSDIRRAISYAIKNKRLLGEQNLRKIKCFDLSSVQGVINTVYSSSACTDSITPPPQRGEYRHLKELSKWQEKRKEIGVPLTARLLLSVGELSVRKNHKVVIEALQELPSDYWYVIVGKGELGDSLRSIDKTGRLRLLGYRTDIVELLRASDLFVFPSLQEGLPVALMEAMSCGVTCIASRIRGNVDLLTEDVLLFDVTDDVTDNERLANAKRLRAIIETEHNITSLPIDFDKHTIIEKMRGLYNQC